MALCGWFFGVCRADVLRERWEIAILDLLLRMCLLGNIGRLMCAFDPRPDTNTENVVFGWFVSASVSSSEF